MVTHRGTAVRCETIEHAYSAKVSHAKTPRCTRDEKRARKAHEKKAAARRRRSEIIRA